MTISPGRGPSSRMDIVMPSRTPARMSCGERRKGRLSLTLNRGKERDLTLGKDRSIFSAPSESARRSPLQTVKRKNAMKGTSFGLMKACPHRRGWDVYSRSTLQALQTLNQRFANEYRHNPPSWKSRKYEKCQTSAAKMFGKINFRERMASSGKRMNAGP